MFFTMLNYSGAKYGSYVFPSWANVLGWTLSLSSVLAVPAVAAYKLFVNGQSVRELMKPSSEWTAKSKPDDKY